MFPTSESLLTLKVLTDIALMSGIILVGLKVLMSPSRNPKQIMELDAALKSLIREADHAGRDLNDQLLGRQQVLERLLVDLQSTESRLNSALTKIEEGRRLLEQASARADGIKNLLNQQLDEMVIPPRISSEGQSNPHRITASSYGDGRNMHIPNRTERAEPTYVPNRFSVENGARGQSGYDGSMTEVSAHSGRTAGAEFSSQGPALKEYAGSQNMGISADQKIETRDEEGESLRSYLNPGNSAGIGDTSRNLAIDPRPSSLQVKTPLMSEIERETVADPVQAEAQNRNFLNTQPLASLVERELQQTRSAVRDLFSKFEQIESRVSSANASWENGAKMTQQPSQIQTRDSINNNVLLTRNVATPQGDTEANQQSRSTNINRNDQRLGALGPIKREVTVL